MRYLAVTAFLLLTASVYAANSKEVTVQVVNTQTSERQYSYYVPGTAGSSHTNCDTNATANTYGNSTNVMAQRTAQRHRHRPRPLSE